MKNQWWVWLLTGLLVLSALFIGCDELDDDDDDDSTPSELEGLVGMWVMGTGTVNGDPADYSSIVEFEENGDGVNYVLIYGDEDTYEVWNYTWEDVEGELEIDPDGDEDPFTIDVDFDGDDIVNFDYTYEGEREETYYRVTSNHDSDLYGLWIMTSVTANGEPVAGASGTLNFTNDGEMYINVDFGEGAEMDTMSWSTISDYIVLLGTDDDAVTGEVVPYTISGTTLTVNVYSDGILQVITFDEYQPGEIDEDLVGRWMTYQAISDGAYLDFRETVILNADGTGISYHGDVDDDDFEVEAISFIWEVVDGVLMVDTEQDPPMEIDYTVTENELTIDFEMDGDDIHEIMIKWTGEVDDDLVGQWILDSETIDGQPTEIYYALVTLNNDGTGNYVSEDGSDEFTWCVNDGKLLIPVYSYAGYVGEYTVTDEEFSMTEYYSFGVIVSNYVPFTPGEDLDPDLFGTWIGTTRYVDGSILDGYSYIELRPNGTGVFAFELEYPDDWQTYYNEITWTTDEGVLSMYQGTTLLHAVTYSVNGDVAETEYTDDMDQFFEQDFYRWTGETPSGFIGTWIIEDETLDGSHDGLMMSMASTVTMAEDGTLFVRYGEYDEETGEETIVEASGEWCIAEDHFLMAFDEELDGYMLCEALLYSLPMQTQVVFDDPRDEGLYIFTYRKFEGTVDADMVGTWVGYLYTLQTGMGDWQDSEQMQTIVANSDGTGTSLSAWEVEEGVLNDIMETEVVDFEWLTTDDGRLLVIDEEGRGSVMPFNLNADFMEMTMTINEGEMTYTMVMEFVRKIDELDASMFGDWVLTDVLEDGESIGVEDPMDLSFNEDGGGDFEGETESGIFVWSTSNGYLIIRVDDTQIPEQLYEGVEYTIEENQFILTSYYVDYSGMPRTVEYTEVFSRPTR